MNHIEALRTIAEYPVSAQDDMQAANMRKIAVEALERLRSPAEPCRICFEDEPHTGTCGSSDPQALCNLDRAARAQAPAAQCETCNDNGAVGNILTAEPCPDCSAPAAVEPVAYQFQDREGNWLNFVNEQHRLNTIEEGSWPIRALYAAPSIKAEPAPSAVPYFGLAAGQIDKLRTGGLKPEEIAGSPETQLDRVRELVWWFARFADGNANPKWLRGHAFELAYYIANMDVKRGIDLKPIRDAAFKEGAMLSPAERGMLECLGVLPPMAAPADALDAVGFSPMYLAPLDGTPVLLYLPTTIDKFAIGQWHGPDDSVIGNWGDDEGNFYVHTPAAFMSLRYLSNLAERTKTDAAIAAQAAQTKGDA